jgi:cysteine synthase A
MKSCQINPTIIDALLLPHVIQLRENLFGAAFFLMKLLPAHFILENAQAAGLIGPSSTIVETTSGTFGLALAMLCNQRRYELILVSDPAIDDPFRRRLEELGATVNIVRAPAPIGGFQRARLDRLAELQSAYPDHFWPAQYDNDDNPGGYSRLADFLVETIGQIDCLVGTVGSGGSMCGTSRYLRKLYPHMLVVGVDTPGSVLFGHRDRKRLLRGLGNSLMPRNVNHTAFDEVHWVGAAEGFLATRELYRRHALYMGPTSGTVHMVAHWWAQQHPDANVVVLLPDEGYRYQETVYNDLWLRANNSWLSQLPAEPQLLEHPIDADRGWSRFLWKRRTYEEVLGVPFRSS